MNTREPLPTLGGYNRALLGVLSQSGAWSAAWTAARAPHPGDADLAVVRQAAAALRLVDLPGEARAAEMLATAMALPASEARRAARQALTDALAEQVIRRHDGDAPDGMILWPLAQALREALLLPPEDPAWWLDMVPAAAPATPPPLDAAARGVVADRLAAAFAHAIETWDAATPGAVPDPNILDEALRLWQDHAHRPALAGFLLLARAHWLSAHDLPAPERATLCRAWLVEAERWRRDVKRPPWDKMQALWVALLTANDGHDTRHPAWLAADAVWDLTGAQARLTAARADPARAIREQRRADWLDEIEQAWSQMAGSTPDPRALHRALLGLYANRDDRSPPEQKAAVDEMMAAAQAWVQTPPGPIPDDVALEGAILIMLLDAVRREANAENRARLARQHERFAAARQGERDRLRALPRVQLTPAARARAERTMRQQVIDGCDAIREDAEDQINGWRTEGETLRRADRERLADQWRLAATAIRTLGCPWAAALFEQAAERMEADIELERPATEESQHAAALRWSPMLAAMGAYLQARRAESPAAPRFLKGFEALDPEGALRRAEEATTVRWQRALQPALRVVDRPTPPGSIEVPDRGTAPPAVASLPPHEDDSPSDAASLPADVIEPRIPVDADRPLPTESTAPPLAVAHPSPSESEPPPAIVASTEAPPPTLLETIDHVTPAPLESEFDSDLHPEAAPRIEPDPPVIVASTEAAPPVPLEAIGQATPAPAPHPAPDASGLPSRAVPPAETEPSIQTDIAPQTAPGTPLAPNGSGLLPAVDQPVDLESPIPDESSERADAPAAYAPDEHSTHIGIESALPVGKKSFGSAPTTASTPPPNPDAADTVVDTAPPPSPIAPSETNGIPHEEDYPPTDPSAADEAPIAEVTTETPRSAARHPVADAATQRSAADHRPMMPSAAHATDTSTADIVPLAPAPAAQQVVRGEVGAPATTWNAAGDVDQPPLTVSTSRSTETTLAVPAWNDADPVDHLETPALQAAFEEELDTVVPAMRAAVGLLAMRPDHPTARADLLRACHTLKGSGRLVGYVHAAEVAWQAERRLRAHKGEWNDRWQRGAQVLLAWWDGLRARIHDHPQQVVVPVDAAAAVWALWDEAPAEAPPPIPPSEAAPQNPSDPWADVDAAVVAWLEQGARLMDVLQRLRDRTPPGSP